MEGSPHADIIKSRECKTSGKKIKADGSLFVYWLTMVPPKYYCTDYLCKNTFKHAITTRSTINIIVFNHATMPPGLLGYMDHLEEYLAPL